MDGLEIYMPGLPSGLSEQSLKTQLTPFITKKLGYTEWICQKHRGKKFGSVTFLYRTQGEMFLSLYGEQITHLNGRQRSTSRLTLDGVQVKCKISNKNPDPFLLKAIRKTADDIKRQYEDEDEKPSRDRKVVFEVHELACGHYEYLDDTFTFTTDVQWPAQGSAKFTRDMVIITFGTNRVEIPYRTIEEIIHSERPTSLTLTLWEVPRFFFEERPDPLFDLNQHFGRLVLNAIAPARIRLSHLPHVNDVHERVLGQSLVYRIQVSPSGFGSKLQQLKGKEKLASFSHYEFPGSFLRGRTYIAEGMIAFKNFLDECYAKYKVPFSVLFQFQALVQNGYLLPKTCEDLLRRLRQSAHTFPANGINGKGNGNGSTEGAKNAVTSSFPLSTEAVKKLFQIPFPSPIASNIFSPDAIWSYLQANETEVRQGIGKELVTERAQQNLVMVYKVQVTPTRITLFGPEPEAKNRILRKFPQDTEYFARVQFCEEDGQDLYFNNRVTLGGIWDRFKTVLQQGIHIAGRQYMFLGFSHSSLRAHAVWFMAPFVDRNGTLQNSPRVIAELGNFSKIFSPPRCAARIGQAFSETPFSVDLKELGARVEFINDVKSNDGSRVFSDGVGTLSRSLMEAIQEALPKNRDTTTCFQIRWAGAKGMLALDDTIPGMVMRIRPESMVKFESEDTQYLEICDMANKPIPLVLNRQMIKILEDMGVEDEWFLGVQNRELQRLREITAKVDNTVLFLKRQKVAEQMKFSKFVRRLQKLGIDYKRDPFLCSVVETIVLREVRLLKHKARIPVDKGVTLFGIMDEFGFLEEDEIYVTFENDKLHGSRDTPDLCDQLVLVTRSPALHPGDIQVRRAVMPPYHHPLRSLTNCVVFSQKGQRDLPSQLSGGDLDGDIYNIIWDSVAVDSAVREFSPADYPRVSPLNIEREVTQKDMTNFFVDFMATDQLGVIATRHMILADRKPAGTVDEECKTLAELHSTAVDYSKSGIQPAIEKLRNLTTSKYRPEFLAPAPPAHIIDQIEIAFQAPQESIGNDDDDDDNGPGHVYYWSEKVLGKLYRAIDEKKIWKRDIHQGINRQGPLVWDLLLSYIMKKCRKLGGIDWTAAIDNARRIRQIFDDFVWGVSKDYADNTKNLTELEVFTGYIFNKSGSQTRRQRDKSIQLKDEFDRIAKWAEGAIRKKVVKLRADDDASDDENPDESGYYRHDLSALQLSIACLQVSAEKSNGFARSGSNFQSFKVIAAQCALTELEIALAQHEAAEGAALMTASAR
ncbi:hypothetical protein M426DRAFT_324753 [Hypoxylon sp. CI-4A]|nr:hypothetical protein M426DRAFT_324753 [Hypoxylon sp. CI-4A]